MAASKLTVKSIWKDIEQKGCRFYCVGCQKERRVSAPAQVGSPPFFAHIFFTTLFFSLLAWPWMSWKGIFVFTIPVGLVFETFYRLKMRAALICPECSFDPMLYLVDRNKAVQQVELAWRKKFEEKGIPFPDKKNRGKRAAPPSEGHSLD